MEDFYRLIHHFSKPMKKTLATIVRVSGSAYKKEGAAMLFFEDGTQEGMVSAGCLESDLAHHAAKVLKTGLAVTLQYDMREETELAWGQASGCNGVIDVLLEPVTLGYAKDFAKLKRLLDNRTPVLCLKKLDQTGDYVFIPESGNPFGKWKGEIPVGFAEVKSGMDPDLQVFQHLYLPKPRLFVFGAGPDARPLAALAARTGFDVSVCDWRPAFCRKEYFGDDVEILIGFPKQLFKKIQFTSDDFVIVMSHHFQKDQEILEQLLKKEVRYLGVLGPRDRTRRILHGGRIPIHVHSPVGLAIGAKGPEEIAVSVVAQMIHTLRNPVRESVENLWMIPE